MDAFDHEELARNNRHQVEEALGSDNRYFAWLATGRCDLTDSELMFYYIDHGGAEGHRERMRTNPRPTTPPTG